MWENIYRRVCNETNLFCMSSQNFHNRDSPFSKTPYTQTIPIVEPLVCASVCRAPPTTTTEYQAFRSELARGSLTHGSLDANAGRAYWDHNRLGMPHVTAEPGRERVGGCGYLPRLVECCSAHTQIKATKDGSARDSVNTTTAPLNPDSNSPNDQHLTSSQRAQLQRSSRKILAMILWRWEIPFMMLHISIGYLRL